MLFKRLLDRIEEPLAGMGDTTSQDNGLRIDDRGIVGQSQSQDITCLFEDLLGHHVTLLTALKDGSRREFSQGAHQRRSIGFCHHLPGSADDAGSTSIGFEAPLMSTATQTTIVDYTGMPKLAGISQMSHMVCPFSEETAAETYTKTDDDEVLHTMGTAESILTQC